MNFHKHTSLLKRSAATCALSLLLIGVAHAEPAEQPAPPKKELIEATQQAIPILVKLSEENKWDEFIAGIDKQIALAPAISYDRVYLYRMRTLGDISVKKYADAIKDIEACLAIADKYSFFEQKTTLELVYTLAQLYAQEAGTEKNEAVQQAKFGKAYEQLARLLRESPKPTTDMQYYAANILYSQAISNPNKIDTALLKKALQESEKGLYMTIRPKEQFLQMAVAALTQLGEHAKAAEYLEQLVKINPTSKSLWQYLLNAYLSQESPETLIRAIITLERAQNVGVMTADVDNFNLAGLYANAQQYDYTAVLLEKGLTNGTIKSELKNWELLAQSYQQVRKELKAIDTYKRAAKLFPDVGSIDQQIGNLYYQLDKYDDAFIYLNRAVTKKLDKPLQAYTFIAYLGLELKKLDEAKSAIDNALKLNPESKDAKRLLEAINDALEERKKSLAPANKA